MCLSQLRTPLIFISFETKVKKELELELVVRAEWQWCELRAAKKDLKNHCLLSFPITPQLSLSSLHISKCYI